MGAMSAVNSASEAMARVRLYDKLLNANLDLLAPVIDDVVERLLAEQSDEVRDIVRQGLRQHGNNPARLNAYLRSEDGLFSALIPPHVYSDWETILGPARAKDLVTKTVAEIQNMVERGTLHPENLRALFLNMREEMVRAYDSTLEIGARARAASEGLAQPELGLSGLDAGDEIEQLATMEPSEIAAFQAEREELTARLWDEATPATELEEIRKRTAEIDTALQPISGAERAAVAPEEVPGIVQRIRDRVRGLVDVPRVGAGLSD